MGRLASILPPLRRKAFEQLDIFNRHDEGDRGQPLSFLPFSIGCDPFSGCLGRDLKFSLQVTYFL